MNNKAVLYPDVIKALDRAKKRLKADPKISKGNKALFFRFLNFNEANGIGPEQQLSYIDRLQDVLCFIGKTPVKKVRRKTVEKYVAKFRRGLPSKRGIAFKRGGYKPATINKMGQCMKTFWRYAYGLNSKDPAPDAVAWIKREACPNQLRPEDLWTDEDMEKFFSVATLSRDRVYFSTAYESSMRPGELRGLHIRDISFSCDVARVFCRGKTARKTGERVIPLVRSYNLLQQWIAAHPLKNNPDAWLWTFGSEPIQEKQASMQFKRLAEKAGITKPRNMYILRHSGATRMYSSMPGTLARQLLGHVDADMEKVYVHLAQKDLDNAVRKMNGLQTVEERKIPSCPRCGAVLEVGNTLCPHCGVPTTQEAALKKAMDEDEMLKLAKAILNRANDRPELIRKLLEDVE